MVIGQASSGCGYTKISVLRQDDILGSDTKLEILVIVGHSVVDEDCEGVLVILDLGSDREGLVTEVPETPRQLLGDAVILMIVDLGPVIVHGGDVGVVVLVVIVEGVEEYTETNPLVIRAVHGALHPLGGSEPEGQAISPYPSPTWNK